MKIGQMGLDRKQNQVVNKNSDDLYKPWFSIKPI